MALISFTTGWQPGMDITADRLESSALVGRKVFKATRDTNQSLAATGSGNPDVASNAISWETVNVDDLTGWSSGSATRYTCTLAGWYEIDAKVGFNAATGGTSRSVGIYVNGTLQAGGHHRIAATFSNAAITVDGALTVLLAVGDYVQIAAGQDSGGALNSATGGVRPSLEVTFARHA